MVNVTEPSVVIDFFHIWSWGRVESERGGVELGFVTTRGTKRTLLL